VLNNVINLKEAKKTSRKNKPRKPAKPQPNESPHYVIDDDGFVVKVANENILCVHTGGPDGAGWGRAIGRPSSSANVASATVDSLNSISVGIEHMHELISKHDSERGDTRFSEAMLISSADVVDGRAHKDAADSKEQDFAITQLQSALVDIGFFMPGVDGIWSHTESAFKAFVFRCFAGPDRTARLKKVRDKNGLVLANLDAVSALFAVRDACAGGKCSP